MLINWLLMASLSCLISLPISAAADSHQPRALRHYPNDPFISSAALYTPEEEDDELNDLFERAGHTDRGKKRKASACISKKEGEDFEPAAKKTRLLSAPATDNEQISAPSVQETKLCEICKDPFPDLELLRDHLASHAKKNASRDPEKQYPCPICPYNSSNTDRLKKHICAEHIRYKPNKCPHCDYSTVQRSNLGSHIAINHPFTAEGQDIIDRRPSLRKKGKHKRR